MLSTSHEKILIITNHQRKQIKLQWDIASHLSKWPSSKRTWRTNVGKDAKKRQPSYTVGGSVNWCSHYGKQYSSFSKNWSRTTLWPKNSTRVHNPPKRKPNNKNKTLIQKDTCTPIFIAALFTIAKIWKQPKCPSTDEWTHTHINRWMDTHTHTHI